LTEQARPYRSDPAISVAAATRIKDFVWYFLSGVIDRITCGAQARARSRTTRLRGLQERPQESRRRKGKMCWRLRFMFHSRTADSSENSNVHGIRQGIRRPKPGWTPLGARTRTWDHRSFCEGCSKHDCRSNRHVQNSIADHNPISGGHSHGWPREGAREQGSRTSFDLELAPRRQGGKGAHLEGWRVPGRRSFAVVEEVGFQGEARTRQAQDLGK
jgi:hypothetical protein